MKSWLKTQHSKNEDHGIWFHNFMAKSEEELKGLLIKVKEQSEKAELKLNIQKSKIMASSPVTS